jgi:cytochrome P450
MKSRFFETWKRLFQPHHEKRSSVELLPLNTFVGDSPAPTFESTPPIPPLCETLDLESHEVIQDVYPHYELLREQGSVHFISANQFWIVLDYDDVFSGLKRIDVFSNKLEFGIDPVLVNADPPEHTHVRRLVAAHFLPKSIAAFETSIESLCDDLLTGCAKKRTFDLVSDFAVPLTEYAIGALIGLDRADVDRSRQITKAGLYELNYLPELGEFFCDLVKRDQLRSGLSAHLLRMAHEEQLDKDGVVSLLRIFWVAGITTTSMLISSSMNAVLRDRALFAEVGKNLSLIDRLIEETLRYESPEQYAFRITTRPVEIGGQTIPAGAHVRLCIAAANRDPKRYPSANHFSLHRESFDHLAFGHGTHFCIGANLSRLEAKIALSKIFQRLPNLRLIDEASKPIYANSSHFHGLSQLFVTAVQVES